MAPFRAVLLGERFAGAVLLNFRRQHPMPVQRFVQPSLQRIYTSMGEAFLCRRVVVECVDNFARGI